MKKSILTLTTIAALVLGSCSKKEVITPASTNQQTGYIIPLVPVYAIVVHNDNQTHNVEYSSVVKINGVINNNNTFLVKQGDVVNANVSITTIGVCCDSVSVILVKNGMLIAKNKNLNGGQLTYTVN